MAIIAFDNERSYERIFYFCWNIEEILFLNDPFTIRRSFWIWFKLAMIVIYNQASLSLSTKVVYFPTNSLSSASLYCRLIRLQSPAIGDEQNCRWFTTDDWWRDWLFWSTLICDKRNQIHLSLVYQQNDSFVIILLKLDSTSVIVRNYLHTDKESSRSLILD